MEMKSLVRSEKVLLSEIQERIFFKLSIQKIINYYCANQAHLCQINTAEPSKYEMLRNVG